MSQTLSQTDPRIGTGILLRRFFALMLDFFIIGVIFWTAALLIVIFGVLTLGIGWLAFHVLPALPLAYYTLLIGGSGATPGQRAAGLTVRQDPSLALPTMPQALVWSLLLYVSFAFVGIPFLLALLNPRHRAAHDMLSGLVILRG